MADIRYFYLTGTAQLPKRCALFGFEKETP